MYKGQRCNAYARYLRDRFQVGSDSNTSRHQDIEALENLDDKCLEI